MSEIDYRTIQERRNRRHLGKKADRFALIGGKPPKDIPPLEGETLAKYERQIEDLQERVLRNRDFRQAIGQPPINIRR